MSATASDNSSAISRWLTAAVTISERPPHSTEVYKLCDGNTANASLYRSSLSHMLPKRRLICRKSQRKLERLYGPHSPDFDHSSTWFRTPGSLSGGLKNRVRTGSS